MSISRKVIGEGTYGCVHKPAIPCADKLPPDFNYNGYVSKILTTKDAKKELQEFTVIQHIDKNNEYHLGLPIMCDPSMSKHTRHDISKCKHIKVRNKHAQLLILKDGGMDLHLFCKPKTLSKYMNTHTQDKLDTLLLQAHHLLCGLRLFNKHCIVHGDLKPHNIVFNPTTGTMRFIDFGLMSNKHAIIKEAVLGDRFTFHWSYPLEHGVINKGDYEFYKMKKIKEIKDTARLEKASANVIDVYFEFINPTLQKGSLLEKHALVNDFIDGLDTYVVSTLYSTAVNTIIDAIDIHGLGFTFQYMINQLHIQSYMDDNSFMVLTAFFSQMYCPNILRRVTNIDILLNEYENILLQLGVLTRHHISFEHHVLVDKNPIPKEIADMYTKVSANKIDTNQSPPLPPQATQAKHTCPSGKERNPRTNRCVMLCKDGYSRDTMFTCKKTPKHTSKHTSKTKHCPSGKERNPITNRCVMLCKDGYSRDTMFKCKKTAKHKR